MAGPTIKAGGDPSEVFKFIEATFDEVALLISLRIVGDHFLSSGIAGDDSLHVAVGEVLAKGVAVIGPICDETPSLKRAKYLYCLRHITDLASSQLQA